MKSKYVFHDGSEAGTILVTDKNGNFVEDKISIVMTMNRLAELFYDGTNEKIKEAEDN